ncbi:MAG: ABC transporter ATP-binding protein, partial [Planctomycetes bacterium]|nr:ABC transporter ATP-binding protein [Planctomycetota bacterium]
TTLLRCLAGLERQESGSIRIGERVVADAHTNVAPNQRELGLVFQDGALWSHLSALQHLTFAAPGLKPADALALLGKAGLAEHAQKRPGALSGGEAQRLGLVRALAARPKVLLLDEPLRSVDVHQRDALVLLVQALTAEFATTTILVTHDRDEALALATDLVVMHAGQVVEQGPALQLLQQPACAFTAAFLQGAACLPTTAAPGGVATAFGTFPRPADEHADLRLVLLPGDVRAAAVAEPAGSGNHAAPRGRILSAVPGEGGYRLRIALGDQLVPAHSTAPLVPGQQAQLTLVNPPRLLPWQRQSTPNPTPTAGDAPARLRP